MSDKKKSTFFYGWIVVFICFLTVAISYGVRYSFPVFYVSILREFGRSRADTALIFSIYIIVYGLSAPVVGVAVDRLGPRKFMPAGAILLAIAIAACSLANQIWHFYVLYGVLVGFSACAIGIVPNTVLVSRWFVRKRGAAQGIFTAGFGVGCVMAYVVAYMIELMGWRRAFVFLGLLPLGIAPIIGLFQRLDPRDKGLLPDGEVKVTESGQSRLITTEALIVDKKWADEEWSLFKAMKTYRFWSLFGTSVLLWGIAFSLIVTHQVAFAVDQGYPEAFGALIFSLYGLFYTIGNLLGFLSDRLGREMMVSIGLTMACLGILMLILNYGNQTPWFMYTYTLLFGLGVGITSPSFNAGVADLFQGKNFGSITGFLVVGFGVGGFIGPWLGGKIFDTLKTYIPAFYIVIAALFFSAVCVWIAGPRQVRLVAGKLPKSSLKRGNKFI